MTTANNFDSRNRDSQDGSELQVWGKLEYIDGAGAIMKSNGTDTVDEEVPIINGGASFNLKDDQDSEVYLISMGSDTQRKFAIITIPRDKQHQWEQETGGIQNPMDPTKRLEFNKKRTWNTEANHAIGAGLFEIIDGKAFFRIPVNFMEGLKSARDIETIGDFVTPNNVKGVVLAPSAVSITDDGWSE